MSNPTPEQLKTFMERQGYVHQEQPSYGWLLAPLDMRSPHYVLLSDWGARQLYTLLAETLADEPHESWCDLHLPEPDYYDCTCFAKRYNAVLAARRVGAGLV